MTKDAIIGNRNVRSIQNVIIVVQWEGRGFPIRCRSMAHGTIRWEAQCYVIWVGCAIKIGRVATCAGVRRVCIVPVVTGFTIIGDRYVRPREWIDGIVVKGGRRPGRFRVAGSAIGRELRRHVIRVGRSVVICCVTAVTGIGRVVVVSSCMTSSAIVGDDRMRPVQGIIIVVNWERGRFPAWSRGMTHRTIRWDIQCYVVRIDGPVKIRGMASRALRRCACIARRVTVYTIC